MRQAVDSGEAVDYGRLLERGLEGESFCVNAGPGTGKTTLAVQLAARALSQRSHHSDDFWSPVLVLTPDRRRGTITDRLVSSELAKVEDHRVSSGVLDGPGSHRLVRSINSYAHLVANLWAVEREQPVARIPFVSGGDEDAWVTEFLSSLAEPGERYTTQIMGTPVFRMELRNLLARVGEFGLLADDLEKLGTEYDRPVWSLAARAYREFAGDKDAPFTPATPHADTARMPRIAARLLAGWQGDRQTAGLKVGRPVPKTLIVDDVQDLTVSGAQLVRTVARYAEQVILLNSPLTAAAAFRGGDPSLGERLARNVAQDRSGGETSELTNSGQGFPLVSLTKNFRSAPNIVRASNVIGSWVASDVPKMQATRGGQDQSVTLALSPTDTRLETLIAERLRKHHLFEGVPWEQMAVIVRNAAQVDSVRRRLIRAGIPLKNADRPMRLSSVPICRSLLELVVQGAQELGDWASPDERAQMLDPSAGALDLLRSPLIVADPLAVFRLIRDLRARLGGRELTALDLLSIPETELVLGEMKGDRSRTQLLAKVRTARTLWQLKSKAAQMTPQAGLWLLWDSSGLAETLRERAVAPSTSTAGLVDARAAADQLDATIALFRKADLWSQKRLERADLGGDTALDFASESLKEQVESDSLVRGGITETGVQVLTATASAGQQWSVVCIVGPQAGEWPGGAVGSFGNIGELRAIIDSAMAENSEGRRWRGEVALGEHFIDRGVGIGRPYAQSVKEKRADEAKLFNLAVSRAIDHLHFFAVENEDSAPSVFLSGLEDQEIVPRLHGEDGEPQYSELTMRLDLPSVVGSLRRVISGPDAGQAVKEEAVRILSLLAVEGVEGADPALWASTGSISSDAPVISSGPLRLSPSKIGKAVDCSLMWFLSSVNLDPQDTQESRGEYSHSAWGTMLHEIAEEHPQGTYEELMEALTEKWNRAGFETETHWGRTRWNEAKEQISSLAAYFDDCEATVEVEQAMSYRLGDAVVNGRIDRLETGQDGSVRIIDIKTGTPISARSVKDNPQLLAYQLGLAEAGERNGGAALLQLKAAAGKELALQPPLTAEEAERVRSEYSELVLTLSGRTYVPSEDERVCRLCPFKTVCPAKAQSSRSTE
ncbi:PD-(D/E)XK nuclease family protein [Actinomycetaceae bacterium MB13-C1-2]|nr:PD-(D/E)XK nuclease family protein [Actinomycetaceae bacterium MB13-C1-2]